MSIFINFSLFVCGHIFLTVILNYDNIKIIVSKSDSKDNTKNNLDSISFFRYLRKCYRFKNSKY